MRTATVVLFAVGLGVAAVAAAFGQNAVVLPDKHEGTVKLFYQCDGILNETPNASCVLAARRRVKDCHVERCEVTNGASPYSGHGH